MRLVVVCLTFALAVLMLPLSASGKTQRPLVIVLDTDPPEPWSVVGILREELSGLGYVDGQNIHIEVRSAIGQNEHLPALVSEIIALKPDLIVSANTATTYALKGKTGTIPVVMGLTFDPLGLGFVQSLARPGGSFTGASSSGRDLFGKRIELLKEMLPRIKRLALLWTPIDTGDPDPQPRRNAFEAVQSAAAPAGLEVVSIPVRTSEELQNVLAMPVSKDVDALLILRGGVMSVSGRQIAEFATQHRIPTMFTDPTRVADGGLIGYGPDYLAPIRRAAVYVSRILKGANPADIPVEQPMTFKLVVNMKTARALGLTVPSSIVARADEVIE
jgi:putative tryptophan/tyrosine transport system substrate-binding protein